MSQLPPVIRRAPVILYGLAVLFFVASFVLTVTEIDLTTGYSDGDNPVVRYAKWRGLYQAALDAVYIGANGVVAQILIAIWENGVQRNREAGE